MTTMNTEVYDAFRSVGIDDTKARAAATSLSGADGIIENEKRLGKIEGVQTLHSWMLGTLMAGVASLVLHAFIH